MTNRSRRKSLSLLLPAALAIVAMAAWASPAGAANNQGPNVTCHSGDIVEGGPFHNVTVAKGNFCEILLATITGNVQANNAQQVGVDGSTIAGNVQANNVTDNGWVCGSTVGGNVEVGNAGASTADPGTWFIGDSSWCTFNDAVPGNYIGGNLDFHNNASGGGISNNDVEGNLQCQNNTPPPSGSNNAVDGKAQGQCAAMAGGADDSQSPPDSD